MIEDRWNDEDAWWTMGVAEARRRTHPAAIVVLDGGVLQGEAIFRHMDRAPRWSAVQLTDRAVTEGEDCTVLAYMATAQREGGGTHRALCTSTWVRQDEGWRLVQHQQTEVADRAPGDTLGNYAVDYGQAGEAVLEGAEALDGFDDGDDFGRAQPGVMDRAEPGAMDRAQPGVSDRAQPAMEDDDMAGRNDEDTPKGTAAADETDRERDGASLDLDGDGHISADELRAERDRFPADGLDPADDPDTDDRSRDEIGYDQAADGPGAAPLPDVDDEDVAVEIADDLFGTPEEQAEADAGANAGDRPAPDRG